MLRGQQRRSAAILVANVDKMHTLDVAWIMHPDFDWNGRHAFLEDHHPQSKGHETLREEAMIVNDQLNTEEREILQKYQTLLSSVIHKYLAGRLVEKR